MSYLQAFNFSNPFSVPNFNPFGTAGGLPGLGSSIQTRFGTQSPAGTTFTTTASNQLLVNRNPQSVAAATAASLQIPESIVPNYNPAATTDYYGNPNQNFANQQAPIPPEYQQQQHAQQQLQQQQLQQQQFQQQQLHQQQQAQQQLQIHATQLQLRPQVVQPIPDSSEVTERSQNRDGFEVIIHDGNSENQSAEQLSELEQQQLLSQPPTSRIGRRKKQRNPPRVVNYAPVHQVHYVPPAGIGPHFVGFHPKQKFSVHDVIDDHGGTTNQLRLNNPNSNNVPNANIVDSSNDGRNPAQGVGANANGNVQQQQAPLQNAKSVPLPPNFPQSNVQNNADDADVIDAGQEPAELPQNNNAAPPPPQIGDNVKSAGEGAASRASSPPTEARQGARGEEKQDKEKLRVTPIQGPIFAKDGMVPVVPLFSYPSVNNGTHYQIPILWTALSYALGLEIHGEILRGLPCIKRLNQLYCPTAGQSYPKDKIEGFIDENKALIRRMYGEFIMSSEAYTGPPGGNILRRSTRDIFEEEVPEMFPDAKKSSSKNHSKTKRSASPHHKEGHGHNTDFDLFDDGALPGNGTLTAHVRATRQTVNNRNGSPSQQPRSNRVDSCESTVEIVTPYWAANSGGKVRAIVNTQHFEQAIHQEVCRHTSTRRCTGDCGCEQKYKWHRLLAYDPDNDCRGIFMDWFLFPSCCVCRCNPQ